MMPCEESKRLALLAGFVSAALLLGFLETLIPLPIVVPGMKLGLANAAIVVALEKLDIKSAAVVALAKLISTSFLFGSPVMLAFSAAGTLLSFIGMLILAKAFKANPLVTSIVGAILHNAGQLAVACMFLQNTGFVALFVPLACIACITGLITGYVAKSILNAFESKPIEQRGALEMPSGKDASHSLGVYVPGTSPLHQASPIMKIVSMTIFIIACLAIQSWPLLLLIVLITVVVVAASGVQPAYYLRFVKPLVGLVAFIAVFDICFTATGTVFWSLGPVTLSSGGIEMACKSVLRFFCMIFASSTLMVTTSPRQLLGALKQLTSPFAKTMRWLENALVVIDLTFLLLPLLVQEAAVRKERLTKSSTKTFVNECADVFVCCVAQSLYLQKQLSNC